MVNQTYDLTEHLEYSAKLIGGGSFVIGTILFVLQLINPKVGFEITGLYFIGYAFVINALFFLCLIAAAIAFYHRRAILLRTAALLLINIPIAFVYLYIIIIQNPF